MVISRSRDYKSNLSNYESFSVGVHVSFNHQDIGYTDEEWREHCAEVGVVAAAKELRDVVEEELEEHLYQEVVQINNLREGTREQKNSVLGDVQ